MAEDRLLQDAQTTTSDRLLGYGETALAGLAGAVAFYRLGGRSALSSGFERVSRFSRATQLEFASRPMADWDAQAIGGAYRRLVSNSDSAWNRIGSEVESRIPIQETQRNIFGIFGVFSWAFAATTNTMVSNIIGQQKQEEVLPLIRKIVKLSMLCCGTLTILLNIRPEVLLSFYSQDPLFVSEGISVIRIVSIALMMMSFSAIWLNAVTGTGNTIVNLTIEIITLIFYILYTYLVLEIWNLPITWGWGSELVYWAGMFSMSFWYMRSGRWKEKKA